MTEEIPSAELSEKETPDPNSIEGVASRLMRWGRISPSGLARVEYVSSRAQSAVLEKLRQEFAAQDIPFLEIELPPNTPATEHVMRLRETLRGLPPGVVSITGLDHAFPADVPLLDSLSIINFNRDTLVHFPLRQIWWMQGEMGTTFRLYNPDFDRFFLVRLHLTEIPEVLEPPFSQFALTEGDLLTYEEATQTSFYYNERFYKALGERRSLSELINLCVEVFSPLIKAGHIAEAGECQQKLFAEIERAGYDVKFYLTGKLNLEQMELRDAENFNELSVLRWYQGKYAEAEPLVMRGLTIKRYLLAESHPDTIGNLNNLASLYAKLGRYKEAEPLFTEILETHRKALPEEPAIIAMSLNNLAGLYQEQGLYDKAEPLHQEALAISRQLLPINHLNAAQNLNNLAGIYQLRKQYKLAQPLYKESLKIRRNFLPKDHPMIAISLNNLAGLCKKQQSYSEAESLYQEALKIQRQVLPQGHPDIGQSLNNLAVLYDLQERYDEAEPLYVEALEVCEQSFGVEHPHTKTAHNNFLLFLLN